MSSKNRLYSSVFIPVVIIAAAAAAAAGTGGVYAGDASDVSSSSRLGTVGSVVPFFIEG